ncbi:sigma-B regulation protein RsbU (phosphoserine phosphatase) [Geomicrobium halophilum]|uniref:Sigma-B regulation protein RsbU (Phosphoserine phosphatase) n=1 Tax=Geomicrobium halophilum TaxID=549000 RepID=A0A841PU28_9BACL|nr:PP2C family protein-serine/threonine phosphatase [Geomicrobium halophilum]MBB6451274.1 sigma-B regulation protein RsbU (phosphoserine phosphatase) [Geomicrobium halophilum]
MTTYEGLRDSYKQILYNFLHHKNEQSLYEAQQFSKRVIEEQISPEEIVSIHLEVIEDLYPNLSSETRKSFEILLEVMIGYGMAYREHQILKNKQLELESEIDVAANMQHTFLPKEIPQLADADIGVISVPASKMSGDYYNIVKDGNEYIAIALADIIGKGVPAALCMSMIKYAMDSLPEQLLQPGQLLASLNRTVEQNIAANMFVTMMYASYDPATHIFSYSGAGHEPGFYYDASEDRFNELYAKGLALGISRDTQYREYQQSLSVGDFVVLFSDGVTECRNGDRFLERGELAELIRKYQDKTAQEIVDNVYRELENWQDFQLHDDFTLLLLRREV